MSASKLTSAPLSCEKPAKSQYEAVYLKLNLSRAFDATVHEDVDQKAKEVMGEALAEEDYAAGMEDELSLLSPSTKRRCLVWGGKETSPTSAKERCLEKENAKLTASNCDLSKRVADIEAALASVEDKVEHLQSSHTAGAQAMAIRSLMDYSRSALIDKAMPGLSNQQIHGKRINWGTTAKEIATKIPGTWASYSAEERVILEMTGSSTSPSYDPIIHDACEQAHAKAPGSLTHGELQTMADSCRRRFASNAVKLVGCERLFARLSGYTSFVHADAELQKIRSQVLQAKKLAK